MEINLTENQLVKLANLLFDFSDCGVGGYGDPLEDGWQSIELCCIRQVIDEKLKELGIEWLG